MPLLEKRMIEVDNIEVRTEGESKQNHVTGYGIIYDKEVEIFPGFREKIRKGAFSEHIQSGAEIKSFYNHDASQVLATTRSNPVLYLEDTDKGLRFKAPIPPTTYGNDLIVNLERKNVRGSSFQFNIADEGEILTIDEKGMMHREITKAILHEIGPVTNPAYTATTASLRDAEDSFTECKTKLEKRESEKAADRAETEKCITARLLSLRKNKLSLYI
jgi:hypothetical protein